MTNPAGAARAVIFGECLADVFAHEELAGGAAYNVACHLTALGLTPAFISRVGRDALGQRLRAQLRSLGPCHDLIQVDDAWPTGRVRVSTSPAGHRFEILRDQAYDRIAWPSELPALAPPAAAGLPWLYFGTLAQRSATNRATLERLRRELPHRCFVDLNWREDQVAPIVANAALDQADELKLNAEELALLLRGAKLDDGGAQLPTEPAQINPPLRALLRDRRLRHLIVTYGAGGYAQWNRDGVCEIRGPATTVDHVADTVGAGDAFSAILLAGLLLGWSRPTSLARASEFAAAICAIRGAVPARAEFYLPWQARWGLVSPLQPPTAHPAA